MFKNKKEFAQALINGRQFVLSEDEDYNSVMFFDENKTRPFRYNDENLHLGWIYFKDVKEIKPIDLVLINDNLIKNEIVNQDLIILL